MYRNLEDMRSSLERHLVLDGDRVTALKSDQLAPGIIDAFARNAVFNSNPTIRTVLRKTLRDTAALMGVTCSRIPESRQLDTPAIVIRLGGHCYDLARLVLRSLKGANRHNLIFEQGWAGQSPWEFTALMAAASLREGWHDPLYLRCCLPPLAGDLLDGGRDADQLIQMIQQAVDARFHNLTVRVTPAAVLHERSRRELEQVLAYAHEHKVCVLLRFWDEGRALPARPGEELQVALDKLCSGHPPQLVGLGQREVSHSREDRQAWLDACGASMLSISGGPPEEPFELEGMDEWRPDFNWAERIVLQPEFPAEQRRRLLEWLNRGPVGKDEGLRHNLLKSYEYQSLGHFEFELWNLDGMPAFREDFMRMMKERFA
jgi:hypothetical protein